MRKMIIIMACGVALSSCASTGGISPTQVASVVAQVQAATSAACGYLPAASSVANILATFISGGALVAGGVESAAGAICSALAAKAGRFGASRTVRVHGVVLSGHYVR